MTLAIFSNKNRVLSFFTHTLKKQTPVTLLVTAFCLIISPGLLLSTIIEQLKYPTGIPSAYREKPEMSAYFNEFTMVIFIISLLLMLLLVIINFNFLFAKKTGDVFHALPLRRNELLFTRMLSSFVGAAFTLTLSYGSLAVVNLMPSIVPVEFSTVLWVYIAMLLGLFMCTAITTLFAVCSGGIFDFIIALGGINCGIPVIYYLFLNLLENNAYGVRFLNQEQGLYYTSPYVFAVMNVFDLSNTGAEEIANGFFKTHSQLNFISVIIFILFTVLCLFAVSRLFYVRKSETAGESYSFGIVPHIISVLVSIVGGYVLGYIFTGHGFDDIDFWLFFIFGVILTSITAGAIFTRGFKTVKVSMIRSAVSVALAVLLTFSMLFAAGYIEGYVPKTDKIEKITVGYDEETVFTENFDIPMDIHRAALGRNWNSGENSAVYDKPFTNSRQNIIDSFDAIRINYYLKNGNQVTRQYNGLYNSDFDKYFIRYIKSDEYMKKFTEFGEIDEKIEVEYNAWNNEMSTYETRYAMITPSHAKAILESYVEEFKAADDSAFSEGGNVISLWGINNLINKNSSLNGICVPESFKNTNAIISEIEFMDNRNEFNEEYYGK